MAPPGPTVEGIGLPDRLEVGVTYRRTVQITAAVAGTYVVTAVVTPDSGTPGRADLTARFLDPALAPVVERIDTAPAPAEGTPFELTVVATDPNDDPATLTYEIDTNADGIYDDVSPNGVWTLERPDDGDYAIRVAVRDPAGAITERDVVLQVANLAPEIHSVPSDAATEGAAYIYTPEVTDPGLDDVTLTLEGPDGAALDAEGMLRWTPTYDHVRANPVGFVLTASDGEGGETAQAWSVTVEFIDQDGDDIPDTCEAEYGINGPGDDDGDGRANRGECLRGSSPIVDGRPSAPSLVAPIECAQTPAEPTLEIDAATDPDGDGLLYGFQILADDPAVPNPDDLEVVASRDPIDDLEWTPAAPLAAATYVWRARAFDGMAYGPWTEIGLFVVDGAFAGRCGGGQDPCAHDPQGDADGDTHCGRVDNCPDLANADQADGDHDGIGDVCDACAADPGNDIDGDNLCGDVDNCPSVANGDQTDDNHDGHGDACVSPDVQIQGGVRLGPGVVIGPRRRSA